MDTRMENGIAPPLVVTDLDGTLLDYRTRRVPDGFEEILDRVLASGCAFAAASGRTPGAVRDLFPRHADRIWVVSDNGAMLSRGGRVAFEREIPRRLLEPLVADACRLGAADVLLVGRRACYMFDRPGNAADVFRPYYHPLVLASDPAAASLGDPVRKVVVACPGHAEIPGVAALRDLHGRDLSAASAEPGWFDFMPPGADKGSAVRELQRILGADPGRCVCFGDWENDAPMLAACGRSWAMAGGHPAALAAARRVAPPCSELGELQVLREIFPG